MVRTLFTWCAHYSSWCAHYSHRAHIIRRDANASSRFYPDLMFHIGTRNWRKRSGVIWRCLLMRRNRSTTSSIWSVTSFPLIKVKPPPRFQPCLHCWSPRTWAASKPNSKRGLKTTLKNHLLCSFLSNGRGISEVRGQKWRRRQSPWESSKCQASRCKTLWWNLSKSLKRLTLTLTISPLAKTIYLRSTIILMGVKLVIRRKEAMDSFRTSQSNRINLNMATNCL